MYDNSRVIEIDIDEVLPNRFQPRIQFDEAEILELSDSIKEHGVIQPLVVRTIGDKYEIIAGERRYKASVLAGKETVPVIIKNLNDKDSAEVALIENIQRKNLTPIEEALSYKKILDMGYITQENLAAKLGKSQSSVANKIRLLNLTDEVQEALLENKISERHARSLLKLTDSISQNSMLNRIISDRLTVRRTDEEIEKIKNNTVSENTKEIKEEKEEIDMNNNLESIPSVPQSSQILETQTIQPAVATEPPIQTFDIFGVTTSTPIVPEVPVMPEMPMEQAPVMPMIQEAPQFELNIPPVAPEMPMEQAPVMPMIQEAPQFELNIPPVAPEMPMEQAPVMPMIQEAPQFELNIPPVAPVVPVTSSPQDVVVPQTSPIIENPIVEPQMTQQKENLFSFGIQTPEESAIPTKPEIKMPEPIIITDYSKQYDPVMPATPEVVIPKVDFKEVISVIRECSNKIEQYGFKIDVEEYDLANMYQVIFKIDK